ncbi:hypothetical protein OEZ86_002030 [Tetradesmus obliquus]|nr:hypothetical protein OEZ86_002030 [Tetradesmus obliquus]
MQQLPQVQQPDLDLTLYPGCQSLIDLIATKANATLRQGLMLMLNVLHPYFYYMFELMGELVTLLSSLTELVSPPLWQAYVDEAVRSADINGCSNLYACYGGLLVDVYTEMAKIPAALSGTHTAVTSISNIAGNVQLYVWSTMDLLCDGTRRLTDVSFRKNSFFKLLVYAVTSKGQRLDQIVQHLAILSDLQAKFNSMPYANNIREQQAILQAAFEAVQADIDNLVATADERIAMAQNKLQNVIQQLTNYVPPTPAACDDGSAPADCPDACFGFACPAPWQCQVDACDGCKAVCAQTPTARPTLIDAQKALAIAKEWLELLGRQTRIVGGGRGVLASLYRLESTVAFFTSQTWTSQAGSLAKFGLLSYERRGSISLDVPCVTGTSTAKFTISGYTVKASYPKVSSCTAGTTIQMPTEFIPWVRIHRGLSALPQQALSMLKPGATIPPLDERACMSPR